MWKWLDGKKVIIGTVMLYVAHYFIGGFCIDEIQYSPEWLLIAQKFLYWASAFIVPGGLAHKAVKYRAQK